MDYCVHGSMRLAGSAPKPHARDRESHLCRATVPRTNNPVSRLAQTGSCHFQGLPLLAARHVGSGGPCCTSLVAVPTPGGYPGLPTLNWSDAHGNDPRRPAVRLWGNSSSFQDVARNEAGPRVRPGEAWHVVSRTSRRLRCNEDAKQVQKSILAGVAISFEFLACVPHHEVHAINRSVQMGQYTDLGTAPRYRLEVSITRSESVAVVVEGSLEDLARGTSFHHGSTAAPSSPGLSRLPSRRSLEPSRKLLDRKRK